MNEKGKLSDRLKAARLFRHISQQALAQSIGVSRGVIANIEYDVIRNPQELILRSIAHSLNISETWLVTGGVLWYGKFQKVQVKIC